jgi:23S rRNA (guanosine2251-2'-O)-methyltransferase
LEPLWFAEPSADRAGVVRAVNCDLKYCEIWRRSSRTKLYMPNRSIPGKEDRSGNTRVPYQATAAASAWEGMSPLPVCVLLENVRSLYNVGAFFRTADAVALQRLYLTGITGFPPQRMIAKTALGAEETVSWRHSRETEQTIAELRLANYEIAAIETSAHSIDLFDWQPRFPVCVMFGHETDGLTPRASALADAHIRIPMLGRKHSLNVASAGAVVLYELLRKYRALT